MAGRLDGARLRKVLAVDDDQLITEALRVMLDAEGFDVLVAFDGETAIEQTLAHAPDLIVLDLKLPGISGYEVMRRLKAMDETRTTPIVVTTASDLGRAKIKSFALGASDYLTKPFRGTSSWRSSRASLAEAHPMPKTVLICDDEAYILESVSVVQKEGFTVITADDGEKALALAREHKPDVMFSTSRCRRRPATSVGDAEGGPETRQSTSSC